MTPIDAQKIEPSGLAVDLHTVSESGQKIGRLFAESNLDGLR